VQVRAQARTHAQSRANGHAPQAPGRKPGNNSRRFSYGKRMASYR
jgi:hypothetical protein